MTQDSSPEIHLPPPSFWPIVLALGLTLIAIGVIFGLVISGLGVIVLLVSIAGWTQENRELAAAEEAHHE
ncbi:MAG TPA: cytochrome c oxidase subunit 4 [Anaerolineales bacterium]|nr:cytochrome c oxidase subunit 4 [Anaerolineales bacterium]